MNRLVIADLHEPFTYPTYLRFCREMRDKWECEEVIFSGDIVDNHGVSRFITDSDHPSAGDEYRRTKKKVKRWHTEFPNARVLIGNHDNRPMRLSAAAGIPSSMMRSYSELWETPTWTWAPEFDIDGVKYTHGDRTSGPTAALRRAINARQSVVMGHTHSFGGVQYHASRNDLIFGLNVGWGADEKAYAFEYAKDSPNRGVLGCGVVCSKKEAYFIPADLNGRYRRK